MKGKTFRGNVQCFFGALAVQENRFFLFNRDHNSLCVHIPNEVG